MPGPSHSTSITTGIKPKFGPWTTEDDMIETLIDAYVGFQNIADQYWDPLPVEVRVAAADTVSKDVGGQVLAESPTDPPSGMGRWNWLNTGYEACHAWPESSLYPPGSPEHWALGLSLRFSWVMNLTTFIWEYFNAANIIPVARMEMYERYPHLGQGTDMAASYRERLQRGPRREGLMGRRVIYREEDGREEEVLVASYGHDYADGPYYRLRMRDGEKRTVDGEWFEARFVRVCQ